MKKQLNNLFINGGGISSPIKAERRSVLGSKCSSNTSERGSEAVCVSGLWLSDAEVIRIG